MAINKKQTKELDTLLREACFARDNYTCIRCFNKTTLAPSHIYPKGTYKKMRWNLENVKTLCYRCHIHFWHKNPIEAHEWIKTVLPIDRLNRLKLQSLTTDKSVRDFQLIKLFLEKELEKYEHPNL